MLRIYSDRRSHFRIGIGNQDRIVLHQRRQRHAFQFGREHLLYKQACLVYLQVQKILLYIRRSMSSRNHASSESWDLLQKKGLFVKEYLGGERTHLAGSFSQRIYKVDNWSVGHLMEIRDIHGGVSVEDVSSRSLSICSLYLSMHAYIHILYIFTSQ